VFRQQSTTEDIRMFLTYLRRELRRRRRQAIVIVLGLALGIGLTLTVSAVSTGVKNAQQTVLHSLYGVGTDMTVTKQVSTGSGGPQRFRFNNQNQGSSGRTNFAQARLQATGGSIDDSAVATVARQKHVEAAAGGLTLTYVNFKGSIPQNGSSSQNGNARPPSGGGENGGPSNFNVDSYSVTGVDLSQSAVGPMTSVDVQSGRSFKTGDADAKVVVLSASFAKERSKTKGSTITIAGTKYSVIGIVSASSSGSSTDVYMPLKMAQKQATTMDGKSLTGKVTTVYVKATSANAIDAASSEVKKVLPSATVTTSSDLASEVSGSLASAATLVGKLGIWLSAAVLIAAFAIAALLTISAVSRRVREFGTLKALGWRGPRIVGQIMGEALVQGVVGGVAGIALGLAGIFVVNQVSPTLSASVSPTGSGGPTGGGNGFAGGPPSGGGGFARAAQNVVDVHLSASVTVTAVILAVVLAVAGGLVAGLFGGWRASRLRPADALRRVE
jgi:putative ABC transport system permease protein